MSASPYLPDRVDWTGENPGLYLKADPAGDWTGLASLFRITWSPHGIGHALVLIENPAATGAADHNLVLTDNEPMARWLVANFLACFGAFRGRPALDMLAFHPLESVTRHGDTRTCYGERVLGHGQVVELSWGGLGTPYAVDYPPALSATGRHQMLSLFVDSADATITLNGRVLPGRVMPRPVAGRDCSSAFLAFSETWITSD